jgi:hypothetical protein
VTKNTVRKYTREKCFSSPHGHVAAVDDDGPESVSGALLLHVCHIQRALRGTAITRAALLRPQLDQFGQQFVLRRRRSQLVQRRLDQLLRVAELQGELDSGRVAWRRVRRRLDVLRVLGGERVARRPRHILVAVGRRRVRLVVGIVTGILAGDGPLASLAANVVYIFLEQDDLVSEDVSQRRRVAVTHDGGRPASYRTVFTTLF